METATNQLFSELSPSDTEQPTHAQRGKRKLEFVKCDRCRVDKQKCLPNDRRWPQKCERCIEKGLPCSEGVRTERKKRKTRHTRVANASRITPVLVRSTDCTIPDRTQTTRPRDVRGYLPHAPALHPAQLSCLLRLHAFMESEMRKARSLQAQLSNLFDIGPDDYVVEVSFRKFSKLFDIIETTTQQQISSLRSLTGPSLLSVVRSTSLGKLLLQGTSSASSSTCPVCCCTVEEKDWLKQLSSSGQHWDEHHARLRRLQAHSVRHKALADVQLELVNQEVSLFKEAFDKCRDELGNLLKVLDLSDNIADSIGGVLTPNFPETHFSSMLAVKGSLGLYTDILGRTALHIALDEAADSFENETIVSLKNLSMSLCQRHGPDIFDTADFLQRTPLLVACQKGAVALASQWMELSDPIESCTVLGHTALHLAAANGSPRLCQILLNQRADPNFVDNEERSALFYASRKRNSDAAKVLLRDDYFNPEIDTNRNPPLIEAVRKGSESVVRCLLENGISFDPDDTSETNIDGLSPLHIAASQDAKGILALFCTTQNISLNVQDSLGRSPLLCAIENDAIDSAMYLLRQPGIDINKSDEHENTPLLVATREGCIKLVDLLLRRPEIEINTPDSRDATALIVAVSKSLVLGSSYTVEGIEKEISIIELLLAHPGVDVTAQDEDGRTALITAVLNGDGRTIKKLLETVNYHINLRDKDGKSALSIASARCSLPIIEQILQHPLVEVNVQDKAGRTPLMEAVEAGKLDVVKVLSNVIGIDFTVHDAMNSTALDMARAAGNDRIINFLARAISKQVQAKDWLAFQTPTPGGMVQHTSQATQTARYGYYDLPEPVLQL
ncbi:ankyrin repeat-containing domain protein [Lophiotrema nucula]|uniref:Ankyrin repeat-containing domain protein n=1 Tax=Lophiotrema nucula TaxID=690887 RepID=A0A6A5Z0G9_9PLEO|nr:ankyrin repeat-containing domain protein [Lophiotrema nucula]